MDASRLDVPSQKIRPPQLRRPGDSRPVGGVILALAGLFLVCLSFVSPAPEGLPVPDLKVADLPVAAPTLGTPGADELYGSAQEAGAETFVGGAGDDFFEVAGGGGDRVFCGSGRDLVHADESDLVAGSCETVYRTAAPGKG